MSLQVAIITGAGRGIGRATAIELAKSGYKVVLVSRTIAELRETAALTDGGLLIAGDISEPNGPAKIVKKTMEQFGRVDAIVHCAGIAPAMSIAEMSPAEWRAVIDTNLSAAFFLCQAAWKIFEKQGGGVIVNISSAAARDPFPGFTAYGAAKAGINLLGLSAAREGAKAGIRVHTIAPGAVETKMLRGLLTEAQYPRDKAMDPRDVAQVVVQCVRGDLRYSSGETIYLQKTLK